MFYFCVLSVCACGHLTPQQGNREKADLFEAEGNRIWGRAFGDRYQEEAPPERRPAVGAMCRHEAGCITSSNTSLGFHSATQIGATPHSTRPESHFK